MDVVRQKLSSSDEETTYNDQHKTTYNSLDNLDSLDDFTEYIESDEMDTITIEQDVNPTERKIVKRRDREPVYYTSSLVIAPSDSSDESEPSAHPQRQKRRKIERRSRNI